MSVALVFLGGGIGAVLRHGVNIGFARMFGAEFPWGTLTVNVSGSLVMGVLAAWLAGVGTGGEAWRLFLATGVLGGYTTFSAFSLDAVWLWESGQGAAAALYVAASVIVSIAALVLGLWLGRQFA